MTMDKRRKPSPQAPVATRPVQDRAADDTLAVVGTGVLHVDRHYSIPVQLSMGSEDGIATGLFEITADWEILGNEWALGSFEAGMLHFEVCGAHFLARPLGTMKPMGALLVPAAPFFRALAYETSKEERPWRYFG
jgi:hypothetical protein